MKPKISFKKNYVEPTNCTNSELCPSFSICPQMPSQGQLFGRKAKVFFVFENPAQDDLDLNIPASGSSGQYFRNTFLTPFIADSGGVSYLVNCLIRNPCTTPEGKARPPLSAEKAYCSDIFWKEVQHHKPEVFVLFGPGAFNAFYTKCENRSGLPGLAEQTVGKLRGKFFDMDFGEGYKPKVLVTYHPSFIVRNPASARFFEEDRNRLIAHFKPLGSKAQILNTKNLITIDKIDVIETVKDTLDFFDFLYRGLPEETDLVFDTETDNLHRTFNNKFLCWQFTYKKGHAVVIPIEHEAKPLFADIQNKLALIEAFSKILNSTPEQTRIKWIIGHNLKFDFGLLYGLLRILPKGRIPLWDTLLAMHWLDENRKGMGEAVLGGKPYSLKTLGKEFFKFEYKSEQLAARSEGELGKLSFDELVDYAGTDTILTGCLKTEQEKMAALQNASGTLERYMKYYYSPSIRALVMTECNGLFVRKKHLAFLQGKDSPIWPRLEKIESVDIQNTSEMLEFRKEFKNKLLGEDLDYEEDIWGDGDTDEMPLFNMNKKVHEEMLYLDYLNLKPLSVSKKTEKPSFNKAFLKHYADPDTYNNLEKIRPYKKYYLTSLNDNEDEPVYPLNPLQMILEYRELKKMGTTYSAAMEARLSDPLGECIDSRIRGHFSLSGTDTGRLSASNPNLQQLPGRSKVAKAIKNMFQAEPPSRRFPQGTVLIQLDYKAAEVRWAAIFAKDKNLIKLFNEAYESLKKACDPNSNISEEEFKTTQLAADIHRRTASLMYNMDPAQVKGDQRQASKAITFGLLFGMSVKTLGNNNGWDEEEADEKVRLYFSAFPDLRLWLENAKVTAKKQGYMETLMGRRRRLGFLFDTNDFKNENKALRLAMNAPIQGQSSDAGMIGVCVLTDYLIKNNLEKRWLIENVVHDSCLIQVPFEDIEKSLSILQWCFVEGMAGYLKSYFGIDLPLPIECEFEMGIQYGDLLKWDGRPSTLQNILSELKGKAHKLWS